MKMLAATNNKHKLEEISAILNKLNIEVISMQQAGIDLEVDETGKTFIDNALIKAREIARLTDMPVISDDSGLEVFALNNQPGVKSARYSGVDGDQKDMKNNEKLLKNLIDVPLEQRGARFCSVIAAVFPDGNEITAEGYVYGKIGYQAKGNNGFGYDPLFIVDGYDKTMAEIGSETKNMISHRANALKSFVQKLEIMIK
ncbi:MAG: non-canonical purine NTP pyrophosphatase, RdgB/HAM1 family [Clostridiales bacterium GWB2_37_7]|nr:MAG: non-canonical purine NTP pyrophosphatase, RdgB/HAM1 family [Clostridiales bacterium GWB2_37_7]